MAAPGVAMRALISAFVAAIVALTAQLAARPDPRSPTPDPRTATSDLQRATSDVQIDSVFSAWDKRDSPGCALGLFRDGKVAYSRGYGMASLEHDVPITPESVFYAGSVSKQFTAMAAALAIQQGTLAYDDPIRKYLPELPAYADAIKVRHLIHHTSGLRDYNTLLSIAGRRDEDAWDNRAVLQMTAKQTQLNFTPGDEYLYSNTGYTLLATIVERASGMKFAAFTDRNIFRPLGLDVTHFHVDARRLVRHRALAYAMRDGQWTLDTPINERAGAGGIYTSIPELLKWDENFYTGRVGGAELLKTLQTQGTLNDGRTLTYAWGLQIGIYRGLPIVEHGGSLGGYRAHLLRFPSQHASVALLCNASTITPSTLARRVADLVLAGTLTQPATAVAAAGGRGGGSFATPPPATMPAGTSLADYAGTYESREIDGTYAISVDGLKLLLKRETDAEPEVMQQGSAPDQFRARGLTIRFQRDAHKKVVKLIVDAGRVRGIEFTKR
jgi:CubicO group peptidase (beta-lactamase class C family)